LIPGGGGRRNGEVFGDAPNIAARSKAPQARLDLDHSHGPTADRRTVRGRDAGNTNSRVSHRLTLYRVVRASGGGPAWRRARSNPPCGREEALIFSRDADPRRSISCARLAERGAAGATLIVATARRKFLTALEREVDHRRDFLSHSIACKSPRCC